MNLKKGTDIKSGPSYICPVTGLPLLRRPEWTDVSFGKDYRVKLGILGDSILLSQPSGYVTLHDVENALGLISKVATEAIAAGRPYILIGLFEPPRRFS